MRAQHRASTARCRGFFVADVVVGLILLAVVGVAVATVCRWQSRAAKQLGDQRAATRAAEYALIELHQGRPAPAQLGEPAVVRVEPASGGGAVLDGYQWVRVTATCDGRSITLLGLAKK
jgi:type II secretory pathway pseudopilin PulG